MLDYGGKRTVPEYMNNTCEIYIKFKGLLLIQNVELVLFTNKFESLFTRQLDV